MIWLEICFKHTSSFFVGILYRPPYSSKYLSSDFDVSFEKSLDDLVSEDKEKIILGDINCDYVKANVNGKLKRIINYMVLSNLFLPLLFEENASSPEKFWKCIKQLFPTKCNWDYTFMDSNKWGEGI